VFERVKVQRQEALNRIQLLQVELVNAQLSLARCDEFLRLYQHFSSNSSIGGQCLSLASTQSQGDTLP